MKPLAVIVEANAGNSLPHLDEEVEEVKKSLEESGLFEVILASSARLEDVLNMLKSPDYQNRIVVFHYAGHADGKGLMLTTSSGDNQMAYIQGLVNFFKHQENLFLVFMNGCMTKAHEQYLRDLGRDATLVLTRDRVKDNIAKEFATEFYKQAVMPGASVGKAYDLAVGGIEAEHQPHELREYRPVVVEAEHPETKPLCPIDDELPWELVGNRDINLEHASDQIEPPEGQPLNRKMISICTGLFYLIALLSLGGGYFLFSSPAFQAAFAYGFEEREIGQIYDKETHNLPYTIVKSVLKIFSGTHPLIPSGPPLFGFIVEMFRNLLLCFMFLLTLGVLYNRLPAQGATIISLGRFRISRLVAAVLLFDIAVIVFIVWYHLQMAPAALATENDAWSALKTDHQIWSNAGKEQWIDRWKGEELSLQIEGKSDDSEVRKHELWHKLYWRPYVWYMPYSLVNWVCIGVPMIFIVARGMYRRFERVRWWCGASVSHFRTTRDFKTIAYNITKGSIEFRHENHRILLFVALLNMVGAYEMSIGYLTLARFAQLMAGLAFAMYAFMILSIMATLIMYIQQINEIEPGIAQEELRATPDVADGVRETRQAIETYGVSYVIWDKLTIALFLLNLPFLYYNLKRFLEMLRP